MFVKKRKRNALMYEKWGKTGGRGGGGGEGLISGIIFSLAQMDGLISRGLKTGGGFNVGF